MRNDLTIGLVVPTAEDDVPPEAPAMYPDVRFIARSARVHDLTPNGYDPGWDAIMPAVDHLVAQHVDAIMIAGTSLTFYRGPQAHQELLKALRSRAGLPASTMSQSILDGLKAVGARRVAVATAYTDVVNRRLKELLAAANIDVLTLRCFNIVDFAEPHKKTSADIMALAGTAAEAAPEAEAILISCGGLRTLDVTRPLEAKFGIPVVSSATAAIWAAMRLVGDSGHVDGYGRLFERSGPPPH
jgi:arylmalonate decarboxylase